MRKLFYLISMVMVSAVITGCGPEQALRKADKHYAIGEYYDAAAQYKKAYSKTPSKEREKRGQLAVKMAESISEVLSSSKTANIECLLKKLGQGKYQKLVTAI